MFIVTKSNYFIFRLQIEKRSLNKNRRNNRVQTTEFLSKNY